MDPRYPTAHFLNRELSWLEFNARVLAEAFDERNRLLERLKFLSIFSTNLDEFYMVRVAGLRRQVSARVQQTPPDGATAREQLDRIEARVREMLEHAYRCLHELLLPELAAHGIDFPGGYRRCGSAVWPLTGHEVILYRPAGNATGSP